MEHFPCTKTGQPGVGQILRWRGRKSTRTNPKVGYVGLVEKKKGQQRKFGVTCLACLGRKRQALPERKIAGMKD